MLWVPFVLPWYCTKIQPRHPVGADVRKAVQDGWPANRIIATGIVPDLANMGSLKQLRGHVTTIHGSALFHLFSEEKQRSLALALGSLAPVSGACIFGWSRR